MSKETVELEIERIAAGGYGLARTAEGVVFVRGALPGERVTARPRPRDGVLKAHAIDVVRPHPQRVSLALPPGADLPLSYEAQLPIKQALVEEALHRVAKLFDFELAPIAPSPRTLGYRTAAQYAVADRGLGARATDSDMVVPLASDPLADDAIDTVVRALSDRSLHGVHEIVFRSSLHENAVVVGLLGDNRRFAERHVPLLSPHAKGVVWSEIDARGRFRGRTTTLHGSDRLLEDFGGVLSTVTVQSFAQVNPLAAGQLYREAGRIAGTAARALDLYAGSGALTMHLAPSFTEIDAIDISADAITRGRADARRLGMRNVAFHRGDARTARSFLPADLVAVDPPRAGLGKDVVQLLTHARPPRVLYVSCDPTTWARDVSRLVEAGYRVTFARPYDFYPFTHHVEVLSLLETALS